MRAVVNRPHKDRKGDKKMKEENKYILKDISTDRTYYITLTPEQKRFWNWLVNNGVLCDVSLKEPVVDGFEKI